jgi:hypothetical protein
MTSLSSEKMDRLAKVGTFTHGVVFALVGVLALLAAFGKGGKVTDSNGVIHTISESPFGQVLVLLTAVGLAAYALWQLLRPNAKDLLQRVRFILVGMLYAGLSLTAFQLGTGSGESGASSAPKTWIGAALASDFGPALLIIAGLVIFGAGAYFLYSAYRMKFIEDLRLRSASANERVWLEKFGRAGYTARGIVFLLVGGSFVAAGLHSNPSEAQGMDRALKGLEGLPYGDLILGAVAAGLLAFGLFRMLSARFHSVSPA